MVTCNALSFMFQGEGIPLLMVMKGLKEQTLGKVHQRPQNLILLFRTLLNVRSRILRKGLVGNYCSPTHPAGSGMIAWNIRPMSDHI